MNIEKIVVNASGVDQLKLFWLMKANDGHYYIQHQMNRENAHTRNIKITNKQATEIRNANDNFMAWCIMDRIYGENI